MLPLPAMTASCMYGMNKERSWRNIPIPLIDPGRALARPVVRREIAEVRVTVLKRDWHRVEVLQEIAAQCSSSSVQVDLPPATAVRPVYRAVLVCKRHGQCGEP